MRTGNCWWLAAIVAEHAGRRVVGRTRLQKTVKLLQRVGLPTDYLFTIFFYGPYSEGVMSEMRLQGQLGLVTETELPASEGATATFEMVATEAAVLQEMEAYRPALRRMEATDLTVLELAATYDAFREMGSGPDEAMKRLRHKKAAKCTPEREGRAMALLRELGLG